ncbi:MAG: 5-oxoprolinase subunit PxpA [Bacteroidota bacterium]
MNPKYEIDINADLGEGAGFDAQIMPLISSCSVASGGHYGDETSMQETITLAKQYGVKVGAHPSFPDTDNFGRKVMTMTKRELKQAVFEQLLAFYAVCETEDVPIHHIKLHGALYNYAGKDAPTADAVVEAIVSTRVRPKLYVQYGSILHKKAENLLPLVFEAFIDRNYDSDLSLVPRSEPSALIEDPEVAWEHLYRMAVKGKVRTTSSEEKPIRAETFCIHGDHPHSVAILKYIHTQLSSHSIQLV